MALNRDRQLSEESVSRRSELGGGGAGPSPGGLQRSPGSPLYGLCFAVSAHGPAATPAAAWRSPRPLEIFCPQRAGRDARELAAPEAALQQGVLQTRLLAPVFPRWNESEAGRHHWLPKFRSGVKLRFPTKGVYLIKDPSVSLSFYVSRFLSPPTVSCVTSQTQC